MANSNSGNPTTQRAYTLRLRGVDNNDQSWRDVLWATHESVNKGANIFGDWLLTLRGGLCHMLSELQMQRLCLSINDGGIVEAKNNLS